MKITFQDLLEANEKGMCGVCVCGMCVWYVCVVCVCGMCGVCVWGMCVGYVCVYTCVCTYLSHVQVDGGSWDLRGLGVRPGQTMVLGT